MNENTFKRNILCIGAGYVGGPTMTVIAGHCPDYKITVVDISEEKISRWNSDNLPIFEPGLKELVDRVRGKNLFFSTDIDRGIAEADLIFVTVNTPTKTFGEGMGRAVDLQFMEQTARRIRKNATKDTIVIEKSTIPVRAAETLGKILSTNSKGIHFEILSNPEFMAEGTAVQDMQNPDRVLIGSMESPTGLKARDELKSIYNRWVPEDRIITTNLWSSELSKLVANAFLAQRITSINTISAVCENTGADVGQVAYAVGRDSRIGAKFLRAGVGFGGSCFRKDILSLVYLCEHYGLGEIAEFWNYVIQLNDHQMERFVKRILKAMFGTLVDKKIAVFGFAFKPDTGDTRDAPSIYICKRLLEEKARLAISDPHALENAREDLKGSAGAEYEEDPYKAAEGAHAVALLTEWDCYRDLDYRRIFDSMEKPAYLFDGRNHLDHDALFEIGFNVCCVGKPDRDHFA